MANGHPGHPARLPERHGAAAAVAEISGMAVFRGTGVAAASPAGTAAGGSVTLSIDDSSDAQTGQPGRLD